MVLLLALAVPSAWAGGDWNDDGIAWRSFDDGVAEAKKDGKPVCLVIYTEWCPHCKNYAKVFHDAEIEELSKQFVMIRLDQENNESLSKKFVPDGSYIPRTMFLDSAGNLVPEIKLSRDKYLYFYDEHDPTQLREAMKNAPSKVQKLSDAS